jgi:hypothetical protein
MPPSDSIPFILALGAACAVLAIITMVFRWWINRVVKHAIEIPSKHTLQPESKFLVELTDSAIRCTRPDGTIESVSWNDLQCVDILVTPDGPFLPDTFWILRDTKSGCVIPWGASGDQPLLTRLQTLPDFKNEAILNLPPRTEESITRVWSAH